MNRTFRWIIRKIDSFESYIRNNIRSIQKFNYNHRKITYNNNPKFDKENDTPAGVSVDGAGRALDVDADGVADYKDIDPFTAPGVAVDINGQELDDDITLEKKSLINANFFNVYFIKLGSFFLPLIGSGAK